MTRNNISIFFFAYTNIDFFTGLQIRHQELFFNVNARREKKKK